MRKLLMFAMMGAGLLAGSSGAAAQGMLPLGLEVRGGAAFPTGDFKSALNAKTGVSYGVNATLQAIPMLGLYAGFERTELGVDDSAVADASLTDQGFAFGGKLALPLGLTGAGPWVKAGAIYNELGGSSTPVGLEEGRNWGFEAGGGLSIPLGMVVSVTPGVRYRQYSVDRAVATAGSLKVSYIVADLGLSFGF